MPLSVLVACPLNNTISFLPSTPWSYLCSSTAVGPLPPTGPTGGPCLPLAPLVPAPKWPHIGPTVGRARCGPHRLCVRAQGGAHCRCHRRHYAITATATATAANTATKPAHANKHATTLHLANKRHLATGQLHPPPPLPMPPPSPQTHAAASAPTMPPSPLSLRPRLPHPSPMCTLTRMYAPTHPPFFHRPATSPTHHITQPPTPTNRQDKGVAPAETGQLRLCRVSSHSLFDLEAYPVA